MMAFSGKFMRIKAKGKSKTKSILDASQAKGDHPLHYDKFDDVLYCAAQGIIATCTGKLFTKPKLKQHC